MIYIIKYINVEEINIDDNYYRKLYHKKVKLENVIIVISIM